MKLVNGFDIRGDNNTPVDTFALLDNQMCDVCNAQRLCLNVGTPDNYISHTICLSCINQARYLYYDKGEIMNRKILTNLPEDSREFPIMQKCFDSMGLPFELRNWINDSKGVVGTVSIEPFVNNNNVYFYCVNERDQRQDAIEKACNSLHRIIINFALLDTTEVKHD